ncbi:MAG: bifunctional heptose 7-phosphate kinase/heptose 1-phosphate adenyltransferase [Bacteroidales bacterium]
MINTESVHQLFNGFNDLRIMIVGDVMVDAYLFGKVDRISPEAPVPVVAVESRMNRLGGAANVALNIRSLGATPVLCSVIGNDQKAVELLDLMQQNQMPLNGIVKSDTRITTTKFRVIGNKMQMLRVDEEQLNDLESQEENSLLNNIQNIIDSERIDAVIFQDYNKGVLTENIIHRITEMSRKRNIPVVVDPKKKHFLAYQHVTLFKPNLKELKEGLNKDVEIKTIDQISEAMLLLQKKLQCEYVMVTLSERGVIIKQFADNKEIKTLHFPAHIRNIADVSGAGDTVISVATLCLALGQPAGFIASVSNLAGGIVCEEVGVIPIDKSRLEQETLKIFS